MSSLKSDLEYEASDFTTDTDDRITVIVNHSEMGQGVYTALPMLLAEDLDADWNKVGFEPTPVDPKYNNPVLGMQITGGSTSVQNRPARAYAAKATLMFRSYGNENWEFEENGLMRLRFACINDLPIKESERKFYWPLGRRPDEHPGLSDLGF